MGSSSDTGVTAFLDASDMGLALYVKAGFTPVSRVRRYFLSNEDAAARATVKAAVATDEEAEGDGYEATPLEAIDWDGEAGAAVTAMDAAVFGADRGHLLSAWWGCTSLS